MLNSLSYIDSSFFYIDNLNILKANRNHINSNQFVVAPFSYTFTQDGETISGISYELYYIDEDKNFNQLTYTFKEGNGLYIDENLCVNLNIDNYSLVNNENNELTIDEDSFTTAYYNTRGILHASDNLYVNDILMDKINEIGSMYSDNGTLSLNKGLITDLVETKKYYEKAQLLYKSILMMYNDITNKKFFFNVGDYLYKTADGLITDEKVGDGPIGDPYMICVIASNVLDDGYPRFTLVQRADDQFKGIFSIYNNEIPIKNAFGGIPVYDDDYKNITLENGQVVAGKGGYFAMDRAGEWTKNLKNKFNSKEYFSLAPYDRNNTEFLDWYIDKYYVNTDELYKINKEGVFSETFNLYSGNNKLMVRINISFNDGFTGEYLLNLVYNEISKRFELSEDCLPIVDKTNNDNENQDQNQNLSSGNYYYYSLDIQNDLFDLDKVYLVCYLAKNENCTSFYEPEILEYDNATGLNKTFEIPQTHDKGGIKIVVYASRYLLDVHPYNIGILKPTSNEFINMDSSGNIRLYRKKIVINSIETIRLNINDNFPKTIKAIKHINEEGEDYNTPYMLKNDGLINNGNYDIVNLNYTFDLSYIFESNNDVHLNEGCIKIIRTDNYDFDFTQAQANVKFKVELNNEYHIYTLKNIIFKKTNRILESQPYEITNYPYDTIKSVEISKFENISDALSTTINDYKFSNQANILNNN